MGLKEIALNGGIIVLGLLKLKEIRFICNPFSHTKLAANIFNFYFNIT